VTASSLFISILIIEMLVEWASRAAFWVARSDRDHPDRRGEPSGAIFSTPFKKSFDVHCLALVTSVKPILSSPSNTAIICLYVRRGSQYLGFSEYQPLRLLMLHSRTGVLFTAFHRLVSKI